MTVHKNNVGLGLLANYPYKKSFHEM